MKLSIIIPIYNAEQYLRVCIDSIISQTYRDWEILAVVDGGSDSSAEIMQEYACSDDRIKVTVKSNEGVSVARNVGLQQATGEYILFCDADDVMMPNALQTIVDTLRQNTVDYLRYEFKSIDEKGQDLYPNYEAIKRRKHAGMVVNASSCITDIIRNEFFLWSGAFRRSIIETNNILFLPGCTYNEDTLFIMQFLQYSCTHLYIPKVLYGYRKNSNAVTSHFTEKNYEDVKRVFKELQQVYDNAEGEFKQSVRAVIEHIGLTIYQNASSFYDFRGKDRVCSFCTSSPIIMDWKLINLVGIKTYNFVIPIINIIKKINRKLLYICGR